MVNGYYTMIERIKDNFCEIEGDIIDALRANNPKYDVVKTELLELMERNPFIREVMEDEGTVTLTAEQHRIFVEYLSLSDRLNGMEKMNAYLCGHTDCFTYLREIGALTK